jgi:hypothetical protein
MRRRATATKRLIIELSALPTFFRRKYLDLNSPRTIELDSLTAEQAINGE